MAAELLDGLNKQQREAITAPDGPVLVLAGPGSGKTRVLTYRIAYLIREMGVYPGAVMAVTFTNKAAGEMRGRVERLLGDRLSGGQIGTFHSICARLLRREAEFTEHRADYLIYDTDDQLSVVGQSLNELNIDTKKYRPRQILNHISGAKNELITPAAYTGPGYMGEIIRRVYQQYQEILVANNARDFDDLLMDTVLMMRKYTEVREKYQKFLEYLLVDEFQDTNAAQYELVRMLAAPQNNVFVVGDEDQAIYGFRGADYRNVLQFRRDYPNAKVVLLEQNYRSTQIVLDAARAVIDRNTQRTPKALFTETTGGEPLTIYEAYSEKDEADYVVSKIEEMRLRQDKNYGDFAVMYRTNAQSRALEDAFVKEKIPYRLVGGVGFYKRREVRDLLAYLRIINNPDDSVSFTRIINVPKRGIGKKSIEDFQRWTVKEKMTYSMAFEALRKGEKSPLSGKALKSLADFAAMLQKWQQLSTEGDLGLLLDTIMQDVGYSLHLHETSDTTEEAIDRQENIKELRGLLANSELSLNDLLQDVALVADVDSISIDDDSVTLLTLHAAKGLEYRIVFLTGLEEGLLPHFRSIDEPDGMEEERRLMYVGLTRAEERLYLSYAFRRMTYGDSSPSIPSRFLADIPAKLVEGISAGLANRRDSQRYVEDTTWDRDARDIPEAPSERQQAIRSRIAPMPGTPPLQYRSGMRVNHPVFGEGMVTESKRDGSDEEVTIVFKGRGIKRLMASFANLSVLD